jgi:antitoxin VapB
MALRAKLFQNGGSQAVRLPKEFRFPDDQSEVLVRQEGRRVILEPLDEWPIGFIETLGAWAEPIERPPQQAVGQRRDPFQ